MSNKEDISSSVSFSVKQRSRRSTVTVTTTQILLLKNDPKRIAFTLVNQGASQIRISNRPTLSSVQGLPVPSGATRNFLSIEEKAFVKSEINAIAEAGSNIVEIFEELQI